jgi:DNA-binding NtrC family response regulator
MTDTKDGWILLLDDDLLVTDSLRTLLTEESEWNVAVFNVPSEALSSLDRQTYQVVISDFLMPEMDGVSFLGQVKERQPTASRILLTGYADKQNAIRSINEVGLYQFVEKPWDNDSLLLILRNAMERAKMIDELNSRMERLAETDRSLEELRSRLLKAIL